MPQVKPPFGVQLNLGHPLAQGLIGCWLFNEGYGLSGSLLYDSSGKRNNGILTGGFTTASGWSSAPEGSVLVFNGSSTFVDVPKTNILNPATVTVFARVRLVSWTSDTYMVSNGNSGSDGFHLGLLGASTFVWFFGGVAGSIIYSATVPTMGVWYNVVGTWDRVTTKLYINGFLENYATPIQGYNPPSVDLNIGRRGQGTNFLNASIASK